MLVMRYHPLGRLRAQQRSHPVLPTFQLLPTVEYCQSKLLRAMTTLFIRPQRTLGLDIVYNYFVGALGPKKFVSSYHLRQPGANYHCPSQPFCN
jgi:hypothetical protein